MTKNYPSFNERLQNAAKANEARLAKARANAPANDPDFASRQALQVELSNARDKRKAEAAATKLAETTRIAEEKAATALAERLAAEAAAAAEAAERDAALNQKANDALALKAKQKEGRDAKYAARQARRDERRPSR